MKKIHVDRHTARWLGWERCPQNGNVEHEFQLDCHCELIVRDND